MGTGIAASKLEFQGPMRIFDGPHFQGQVLGCNAKVSRCTNCLAARNGKGNTGMTIRFCDGIAWIFLGNGHRHGHRQPVGSRNGVGHIQIRVLFIQGTLFH